MITVEWTRAAKDDHLFLLEQTYDRSTDAAFELDDKAVHAYFNKKK
ncbi:MAG: hypothetical protein IPM81_11850 [Saprospirales bacterium]|nr:hypothetical protein [Saprospirales bacterium]